MTPYTPNSNTSQHLHLDHRDKSPLPGPNCKIPSSQCSLDTAGPCSETTDVGLPDLANNNTGCPVLSKLNNYPWYIWNSNFTGHSVFDLATSYQWLAIALGTKTRLLTSICEVPRHWHQPNSLFSSLPPCCPSGASNLISLRTATLVIPPSGTLFPPIFSAILSLHSGLCSKMDSSKRSSLTSNPTLQPDLQSPSLYLAWQFFITFIASW